MRRQNTATIDIHGLTETDAYCALLVFLNDVHSNIKKIVVVHGYHGGQVLKNMVNEFNHYLIDYKERSLFNEGETILHLKNR